MTLPQAAADPGGDFPIEAPGVWLELRAAARASGTPGLFLDRDGVVIEDAHYISRREDVRLIPGAATLVAAANRAGVAVAIVSNQSGIARGYFGWEAFAAVQDEMTRQLQAQGARIDAVAACPFHADFTPGFGAEHEAWVKPGPRMITELCARLNIVARSSWLVGDKSVDIVAARRAGLAGAIHVLTGHGRDHRAAAAGEATDDFVVKIADSIADCRPLLADALCLENPAG